MITVNYITGWWLYAMLSAVSHPPDRSHPKNIGQLTTIPNIGEKKKCQKPPARSLDHGVFK